MRIASRHGGTGELAGLLGRTWVVILSAAGELAGLEVTAGAVNQHVTAWGAGLVVSQVRPTHPRA